MATIQLNLMPLTVPTSVIICLPGHQISRTPLPALVGGYATPPTALPTVPLKDLAPDDLDALAKTWLDNLFAGVGRRNPFHLPNEKAPGMKSPA